MKKKQAKKKKVAPPTIKKVVAPKKKAARIAQTLPRPVSPATTMTSTQQLPAAPSTPFSERVWTINDRDRAMDVLIAWGKQNQKDFYTTGGEKGAFGRRKPLAAIAITKDAIDLLSGHAALLEGSLDVKLFG